ATQSSIALAMGSVFGDRDDRYKAWKNDEYNEGGLAGESAEIWNKCYKGIRQASIYLNNILE
ncbi:hypothetical protein, partial [Klebsiella variicola]|uniref:hypothetical protein n=1 Tax=Klebsiella variicola TaxID=244366 RepID=UPI0019540EBB